MATVVRQWKQDCPLEELWDQVGSSSPRYQVKLEMGGWFTTPASESILFGDPEAAWDSACQCVGLDVISGTKGVKRFPSDPSCN